MNARLSSTAATSTSRTSTRIGRRRWLLRRAHRGPTGATAPGHHRRKVGQSLRVRLIGTSSALVHPIHIRGGPFRILATDGNAVPPPSSSRRTLSSRTGRALRRHLDGAEPRQVAAALPHQPPHHQRRRAARRRGHNRDHQRGLRRHGAADWLVRRIAQYLLGIAAAVFRRVTLVSCATAAGGRRPVVGGDDCVGAGHAWHIQPPPLLSPGRPGGGRRAALSRRPQHGQGVSPQGQPQSGHGKVIGWSPPFRHRIGLRKARRRPGKRRRSHPPAGQAPRGCSPARSSGRRSR
jgi:hypothetical protein